MENEEEDREVQTRWSGCKKKEEFDMQDGQWELSYL